MLERKKVILLFNLHIEEAAEVLREFQYRARQQQS